MGSEVKAVLWLVLVFGHGDPDWELGTLEKGLWEKENGGDLDSFIANRQRLVEQS